MPYQAWQFGGAPDQLAELVLQGKKRGTSSAYDLYALDSVRTNAESRGLQCDSEFL